jgi:hypothetical protein
MGPIRCPETSVANYQCMLHNIPEMRRSHLHRGGSLKSVSFIFSLKDRHTLMKLKHFSKLCFNIRFQNRAAVATHKLVMFSGFQRVTEYSVS